MRDAFEDVELDMLEGLDIGSCQWQDGAELDAAGAVCLNAVPALIRDVREARRAAELVAAGHAVKVGATKVVVVCAGDEFLPAAKEMAKVVGALDAAREARADADRRADEAQRQLATVVAERGEALSDADALRVIAKREIGGASHAKARLYERIEQLAALARREHDDTNRGCGKAWDYDGPCTCGADEHNAKVEALLHA